jgi:hypothetical protein
MKPDLLDSRIFVSRSWRKEKNNRKFEAGASRKDLVDL